VGFTVVEGYLLGAKILRGRKDMAASFPFIAERRVISVNAGGLMSASADMSLKVWSRCVSIQRLLRENLNGLN